MKDRFGNDLKVGDPILVVAQNPSVFGRILALTPGTIAIAKSAAEKPTKNPDIMTIAVDYVMDPPYNGNIHKIHEFMKPQGGN